MGKKKTQRQANNLTETISEAVSEYVGNARDKTGPVLADARDRAVPVIAGAAAKAGPALADARSKAVPVLLDAKDRAVPVLVDARDRATPVLVMAREKAAPYFSDAIDKATPVLSSARDSAAPVLDKAAPVLSDAKDRFTAEVLPIVTAAISALESATEDARAEAGKRTKALATALKGEVAPPPKKHTGRNVLVALGLGGAAFAVVKRLTSKQPTTSWQSSYTPPPAPTPSSTGGPVTDVGAHRADTPTDTAASDPGEAVADAAEVPHDATTPDNPATEIDVDPAHKA
jgi:hypothetical protein